MDTNEHEGKPDLLSLASSLEHLATRLEEAEEHHWAAWLRDDASKLRNGILYGVEHFLHAFGGMGSINDISIPFDDPIQKQLGEAFMAARELARYYRL